MTFRVILIFIPAEWFKENSMSHMVIAAAIVLLSTVVFHRCSVVPVPVRRRKRFHP